MFEPEHAPRILTEEQEETVHDTAMRILEEIGTDVKHDQARKLLAEAGLKVEDERVYWDRGFVMEQVAKAPSSFRLRARNPERSLTVGGPDGVPVWMNVGGPPFASDLDEGRRSGRIQDHDTLVKLTHAADVLNCVQVGRARGDGPADGGPPHGHGVLGDPVLRQALHDLRHERPARPRRHPHGRDRARRPRRDRGRSRAHGHREPELAADLGLPHDRRAARLGRGEPADRGHAVPARGRDERGERERRARAAGGRGAERRRARAARARGRAVPVRLVLHRHRHAHRLAGVRHARVGLGHPRRRAARAPVRTAVPRRGRARLEPGRRRAGRRRDPDDAVGHEPRRDRRRAARRRLAGGRPHRVVREVRARRRAAAPVPGAGRGASASPRKSSRSTP